MEYKNVFTFLLDFVRKIKTAKVDKDYVSKDKKFRIHYVSEMPALPEAPKETVYPQIKTDTGELRISPAMKDKSESFVLFALLSLYVRVYESDSHEMRNEKLLGGFDEVALMLMEHYGYEINKKELWDDYMEMLQVHPMPFQIERCKQVGKYLGFELPDFKAKELNSLKK